MCKAPNIPAAPAAPELPQAAKNPISLPTKRKRGVPGTASYMDNGDTLLTPSPMQSGNTLLGQ